MTVQVGKGSRGQSRHLYNIFTILCDKSGLYSSGSRELVRGFTQGRHMTRLAFWKKHREKGRLERKETS